MTSYLFDTSVLSATAPGKPPLPPNAAAWLLQQTGNLFVPAFALHELRRGIAKLDRSGATAKAQTLMAWLQGIMTDYSAEILPIDAAVALEAGLMEDAATAAGSHPGLADILIAATAKANSLTLLTGNPRHFQPLGVPCLDPLTL
ncbi:MAG: type II toxin-antitoxin system VapC family toxin [Mesorhizobium sp.]|uniref:type II toxin-antitoxin system VapC family toxin n=1 Tax=Mesorhizobium sp. TaxID=1871066 RepID=UPI00121D09DB|nr:type II toxin-antitoxin system VapC family toxin [Mesorhizobium sp.]TIP30853.1 MAG: type II toxin-antitoxin system VapC family toxin [Mesorhizobium sp.]